MFAFFLPASVTLTLYWRIYKLARNRQKALDRGFLMILGQNMNFLTNTLSQQVRLAAKRELLCFRFFAFRSLNNSRFQTTLRVHFGKTNGMVEHQRRVLRTHERIAKTLGVVSCSFLFCWLPFFGLYLTSEQLVMHSSLVQTVQITNATGAFLRSPSTWPAGLVTATRC